MNLKGLLDLVHAADPGGRGSGPSSASPTAGGISPMLLVGIIALGLAVFAYVLQGEFTARFPRRAGLVRGGIWVSGIVGVAFTLGALTEAPPPLQGVNPVPLTVDSIAAGRGLYQANCAACHGVSARGGGPQAFTTSVPPADLLSGHLLQHTDTDVHAWIADGLPGGMPAWKDKLTDTQIWELVDFLRAINSGQATVEAPTGPPGPSGSPASTSRSASPPASVATP